MKKNIYISIIGIFLLMIIISGIMICHHYKDSAEQNEMYENLAEIVEETEVSEETENKATESTEEETYSVQYDELFQQNPDMVGWIKIENTKINYPVMQTPDDEDYYLSHDFYGNESIVGCPYIPKTCDVFEPSDNIVIYGHNLKTGGMFNKLTYYRDKSYWEDHQIFYFDTLYERHTYQIFAVFKTAAQQFTDDGKPWGYPYHRLNNFATEEEFNKFIADVKGAAFNGGGYKGWTFYDTGITPQYGDKLVCLSTCEYTMKDPDGTVNGRWVVMAVRIDAE